MTSDRNYYLGQVPFLVSMTRRHLCLWYPSPLGFHRQPSSPSGGQLSPLSLSLLSLRVWQGEAGGVGKRRERELPNELLGRRSDDR